MLAIIIILRSHVELIEEQDQDYRSDGVKMYKKLTFQLSSKIAL